MRSAGEITFADAHKQRVGEGWVIKVLKADRAAYKNSEYQ